MIAIVTYLSRASHNGNLIHYIQLTRVRIPGYIFTFIKYCICYSVNQMTEEVGVFKIIQQ